MTEQSISNVPLVEVIAALREDLKTASIQSDPNNPIIIEEIEIELQAVVTKSADANAKAKIEVLNMGKFLGLGGLEGEVNIKGDWAKVSTQKIKLKLTPTERNPETDKVTKKRVSTKTPIK